MGDKIKLSNICISLGTLWKIIVSIAIAITSIFGAMNYYFLPRSKFTEEITIVKQDVKWIKKIFEDAIEKSKVTENK